MSKKKNAKTVAGYKIEPGQAYSYFDEGIGHTIKITAVADGKVTYKLDGRDEAVNDIGAFVKDLEAVGVKPSNENTHNDYYYFDTDSEIETPKGKYKVKISYSKKQDNTMIHVIEPDGYQWSIERIPLSVAQAMFDMLGQLSLHSGLMAKGGVVSNDFFGWST